MKSILKSVIEADKNARGKISEVQQKKNNMEEEFERHKQDLALKSSQETENKLKEKKLELDNELKIKQTNDEQQFKNAIDELEKVFQQNRNEWVDGIFKRCIDS